MDPRDAYPVRADVPWDDVDGRVVLALPRRRGAMERAFARLVPVPENVLVSLEGPAARAWHLADGTRRLREFPPQTHAVAAELAKRRFVRFVEAPAAASDAARGLTEAAGFRRLACRKCRVTQPLRADAGAWWLCPRCRRLNRVPRA